MHGYGFDNNVTTQQVKHYSASTCEQKFTTTFSFSEITMVSHNKFFERFVIEHSNKGYVRTIVKDYWYPQKHFTENIWFKYEAKLADVTGKGNYHVNFEKSISV